MDLQSLTTESVLPESADLDRMPVADLLALMNAEDHKAPAAVTAALPQIVKAVELIVAARALGGRLIYLGAGTSGRLGLLDAVECPPTFGTGPGEVVGLIAGGRQAVGTAVDASVYSSRQLGTSVGWKSLSNCFFGSEAGGAMRP